MSSRSSLALAVALAVILSGAEARGDDSVGTTPPLEAAPDPHAPAEPTVIGGAGYLHLRSSAHVQTDGGSDLRLPPGYYLDNDSYARLDTEVRRLQDQETRLTAENASLKKSLDTWSPGWKTLTLAFVAGVSLGIYGYSKL